MKSKKTALEKLIKERKDELSGAGDILESIEEGNEKEMSICRSRTILRVFYSCWNLYIKDRSLTWF